MMKKLFFTPLIIYTAMSIFIPRITIASWCVEEADAPKRFFSSNYRAIAVDENNNPHIAYGGDHLYYTYYDGIIWHYETVDTAPGVGDDASLALDADGKAHISYRDGTNYDLKYATNKSGAWITETVDSAGSVGWSTALVLDSDGRAHISYYDSTNDDLRYATNKTGLWVIETVDIDGNVGGSSSIMLDSKGMAHISYHDSTNEDLKYATNKSGAWITETADSAGSVGSYTSLVLDSEDKAHISYHDGMNYDLRYATNKTDSWVIETVDVDESVGYGSSIMLGSKGMAHISYFYRISPLSEYSDLKYATNKSGVWMCEFVDISGDIGDGTSLALDSDGKAHISYHDERNYDLKYATNKSGVWITETVASTGYVSRYNSLALDSEGKVHISNANGYSFPYGFITYMYATNKSGVWELEGLSGAGGLKGWTSSIALDSEDKVHISYFSDGNENLNYGTNRSGEWIWQWVDYADYVGEPNSLAIDAADMAHISYYDNTNHDLKYATNRSGTWVAEAVDTAGWVGKFSSLALDSEWHPHISYFDASNEDLKYAYVDDDCFCHNQDNCPDDFNPTQFDCDNDGIGDICDPDTVDIYPPQGNGIGDTCDCEGNFNCSADQDVDGSDASTFKADFGRSVMVHPCIAGDTCNGDFNCDGDVDGSDASLFKADFGRSLIQNPCPACVAGEWCGY